MKTNRCFSAFVLLLLPLCGIASPGTTVELANADAPAAKDLLSEHPRLKELIAAANRSSGPDEIIRLAEAGADDSVIQTYVESSGRRYDLDADQIIQLHKRGVSSDVITSMIRRKANVQTQPVATPPVVSPPIVINSEAREAQPASTVTYIRSQPRGYYGPYRYAYRPLYIPAYPCSGWSPYYRYGYGDYCPTAWNYRPAWAYDFRFRGCW